VDLCATTSAFYFDPLKGIGTYVGQCAGPSAGPRRRCCTGGPRPLPPARAILSFTAEEAWRHLPRKPSRASFSPGCPAAEPALVSDSLEADFSELLRLRQKVISL